MDLNVAVSVMNQHFNRINALSFLLFRLCFEVQIQQLDVAHRFNQLELLIFVLYDLRAKVFLGIIHLIGA
jgi:hypothetical protein